MLIDDMKRSKETQTKEVVACCLKYGVVSDEVSFVIVDKEHAGKQSESLKAVKIVDEVEYKRKSGNRSEEYSLKHGSGNSWLNSQQALCEQLDCNSGEPLEFKKKFFVCDSNVERSDPVQLDLLYKSSQKSVASWKMHVTEKELVNFRALESVITGTNITIANTGLSKRMVKLVQAQARTLVGMNETNAKYRYVQCVRACPYYGATIFSGKMKVKRQFAEVEVLIFRDRVEIFKAHYKKNQILNLPLVHIKRWAVTPTSFTLDPGSHGNRYISIATTSGEQMAELIGGYIDSLLKRKECGTTTLAAPLPSVSPDPVNVECVNTELIRIQNEQEPFAAAEAQKQRKQQKEQKQQLYMQLLVAQDAVGYWNLTGDLVPYLKDFDLKKLKGIVVEHLEAGSSTDAATIQEHIFATILTIEILKLFHPSESGEWTLMVKKAEEWLSKQNAVVDWLHIIKTKVNMS
eukprot:TRINITY_DN13339_c0_g1_i1.p1 TRINITY_DN13339_c0_g1~~TRINITY_DN13339_c0_g1_i1.p1  ORF type:complete len:461 (-),score=80.50 TRINITY_DN13339_c0_g1_i1:524-1906(-)